MDWRMKKRLTAFIMAITLLFSSCGQSGRISADDSARMTELGNALVKDLKEKILPYRDAPEKLAGLGYILSEKEKSSGMDILASFFARYGEGEDAEVTIIFIGKSFVVTRILFTGGAGYYFRYEYDPENPGQLSVSGRLADAVDLKYQEDPPKWTLWLEGEKKQIAEFEFKNPRN